MELRDIHLGSERVSGFRLDATVYIATNRLLSQAKRRTLMGAHPGLPFERSARDLFANERVSFTSPASLRRHDRRVLLKQELQGLAQQAALWDLGERRKHFQLLGRFHRHIEAELAAAASTLFCHRKPPRHLDLSRL